MEVDILGRAGLHPAGGLNQHQNLSVSVICVRSARRTNVNRGCVVKHWSPTQERDCIVVSGGS